MKIRNLHSLSFSNLKYFQFVICFVNFILYFTALFALLNVNFSTKRSNFRKIAHTLNNQMPTGITCWDLVASFNNVADWNANNC